MLDILCAPDASGDEILKRLRRGGTTYDDVYEQVSEVRGANRMTIDATAGCNAQQQHNENGSCDCDSCWSPSTVHSNMLSSASDQSPFSFMDSALDSESASQGANMSD